MKELPPIYFADYTVEPGPVDLEIEASFTRWIFPTDKRQELFATIESERQLVELAISKTGFGRDGMATLSAIGKSVLTFRRYVGVQKVQAVAELLLKELKENPDRKYALFALHRDVIEGLRSRLSKYKAVTLYGATHPEKRHKHVDRFQNNPKCRVFIGHIQAVGIDIVLTAADHILFIEQDWARPEHNAQAAMRVHKLGQTKPVVVRFIGLEDSIDASIAQALKRRTREIVGGFDYQEQQASHSKIEIN